MNKRNVMKTGFLLALAAVPFHANALTRDAGLKACADAMVNDLASRQGAPLVYNMDPSSKGGTKSLGRQEVFHLDAFDPAGERIVARMDCTVNRDAQVTRLIKVPLDGEDARVRATTFN
jgi:hypothetical protein